MFARMEEVHMNKRMQMVWLAGLWTVTSSMAMAALPEPEPGLWQMKAQMRLNGQDLTPMLKALQLQLMSQVPADQRDQAASLAENILDSEQICLTPKQAKELADPKRALTRWADDLIDSGCQIDQHRVSGNRVSFEGQCRQAKGSHYAGDIQGEVTYHEPRRLSGKFQGDGQLAMGDLSGLLGSIGGKSSSLRTELAFDMNWLGTDCGSVKPAAN